MYDDLLNNTPAVEQSGQPLSKEDYAAKKKTEREELFALSDDTALAVSSDGGKFQKYLDVQSKFDRYSAVNALLVMAQESKLPRQNASRLGDFDYWKSRGGAPRLGQTGIAILEPREYTKEDNTPGVGYNVKKVFDISQINTRKLKATPPPPTYTDRQILGALISNAHVQITGVDTLPDGAGAKYDPQADTISVRKGMEFADTFRSVAQELAYADLSTGPDTQADPKFSAYCASYMLCKKHGVDTQSFDFAEAPKVLVGKETRDVKSELSQIRDVAEDISGRMARQLEAVSKPPRDAGAR